MMTPAVDGSAGTRCGVCSRLRRWARGTGFNVTEVCSAIVIAVALAGGYSTAIAQPRGPSAADLRDESEQRQPLLFHEAWQQPPYVGTLDDRARRITQAAVSNPDLRLHLYGEDAGAVEVWTHEGRRDLWTGLTKSPVAVTLEEKNAYIDLTGRARLRWMTRTENLHVLHPVVKLADGTLLAGSQAVSSPQTLGGPGEFVVSEVTFDAQRWFTLDPVRVVTTREVLHPDLSRVQEIGFVDLMPGGGHGFDGCSNVSWIELYAGTHKR